MTYVCYIDVLFLVNWVMNVAMLLLTGKFLRRQIRWSLLGMAAAVGGLWACVSAVILWDHMLIAILRWWFDWFIVPKAMVFIAYPDKSLREQLRGMLCLYVVSALMGGLIHMVWENTAFGHFWQVWMAGSEAEAISVWLLALSLLGGVTAMELGRRYRETSSRREQIQEVVLYAKGRQWTVKALWDSGNQLKDLCTGKAVHIVEGKEIKALLGDGVYQYLLCYMEQGVTTSGEKDTQGIRVKDPQTVDPELPRVRLIPCRSLGSACTLVPVFAISKIRLADGSWLPEPLIGLSPVSLSEDGSYGMLLHSQTDEMRRNQ